MLVKSITTYARTYIHILHFSQVYQMRRYLYIFLKYCFSVFGFERAATIILSLEEQIDPTKTYLYFDDIGEFQSEGTTYK